MEIEEFCLDSDIQRIVDDILASSQFKFVKQGEFLVRVVTTDKKEAKWGAKCVKTNSMYKFITGVDFYILIRERAFEALTAENQLRLLIHECRHIDYDEKKINSKTTIVPKSRSHSDRFCTHISHDHGDGLVSQIFNEVKAKLMPKIEELPRSQENLEAFIEA